MQWLLVAAIQFAVSVMKGLGIMVPATVTEALEKYADADSAADAARDELSAAVAATAMAKEAEIAAEEDAATAQNDKATAYAELLEAIKTGFGD